MATGFSVRHKGNTKAALDASSTIIPVRELVLETDTNKAKVGNGTQRYSLLPYLSGEGYSLEGSQFFLVRGTGTDTQNGAELQSVYTQAAAIASSTNRVTIGIAPGRYRVSGFFQHNTQYINLVSLTGEPDVIFVDGIDLDADNSYIRGIKSPGLNITASNLSGLVMENCVGTADGCFGVVFTYNGVILSGTFINCEVRGQEGFAVNGICSGTFINCKAGGYSFAHNGQATGTFINCKAGDYSFGGHTDYSMGYCSGTFIDCIAGDGSFLGPVNGSVFTRCVGGETSWYRDDGIGGKLYYCRITSGGLSAVESGVGRVVLCVLGDGQVVTY